MNSLNPHNELNKERIRNAGEGSGKSGSFFFFSYDSKFIIKTMTESELKTFKKLFEDYYNFIIKDHK